MVENEVYKEDKEVDWSRVVYFGLGRISNLGLYASFLYGVYGVTKDFDVKKIVLGGIGVLLCDLVNGAMTVSREQDLKNHISNERFILESKLGPKKISSRLSQQSQVPTPLKDRLDKLVEGDLDKGEPGKKR